MFTIIEGKNAVNSEGFKKVILNLYSERDTDYQRHRYLKAIDTFQELFSECDKIDFYSAPGRTEISGNHTDHQHGCVLAASVNLDALAVVSPNSQGIIRIKSEGYPMCEIGLDDLTKKESELNTTPSIIRGIVSRFNELGYKFGGFNAYVTSNVLKGSGLSSSAAFEVLVGTILSHMYNDGQVNSVEIAQIGQYAENVFFGKPCGLMDQMASSVGGFVFIDFENPNKPIIKKIDFDLSHYNHALCIVDTGGNHADLTDDYASVPKEMTNVAVCLGKKVLRDVSPAEFYKNIPSIRKALGDRAVLRAIHFFAENQRPLAETNALENCDFDRFLQIISESGQSSFMYNQNVFSSKDPSEQGISLALALTQDILKGRGAYRVHGGGFAGTIQAFVPFDLLESYKNTMDSVFGKGSAMVMGIRPVGGANVSTLLK